MRTRSALVGRQAELELAQRLVAGGAATVLLLGDAGIGKSRLLAELSDGWHRDGLVVLAGDCLPFAHPLPLLPMAEGLRRLARVAGGALLRDALHACSPYVTTELSRLLPSLAATCGPVHPGGDQDSPGGSNDPAAEPVPPEWRREQLYAAFADLVDALGEVAPVVLAIEDVHWADSSTLDLLTYLRSRSRASLVLTCRADEPDLPEQVAPWLVRMRRGGLTEVRLRPLSRVETGEQIGTLTGAGPAEPLVADVHALSEGNPFFTEQLVAGAGPDAAALPTRLPSGLTDFLQARVSGLPPGAQAVLDALAVAARPLSEALLVAVTGLDDADVRDGLRLLRERHLLADPLTAEGAGLRHVLLGQAAQERLLPAEHRSVHARVAQALQRLGDDSLAAATAAHWHRAGRPQEALRATLAAGEYATRVSAYADAAREWRRAADLAREVPEAATELGVDWLDLLVRTVDCLDAAGQGEEAGRLAERSLADRDRWPDSRAAAALLARAAHLRAMRDPASARPLLEEALRLFALEPPSRDEAEAHRLLAYLSMQEGRAAEGVERLRRARDVAQAAGSRSTEARVIANLAYAHVTEGRSEEATHLLEQGRALADELDEAGVGTGALEWIEACACVAYWHLGRMSDCYRSAMAGYGVAERHGRGEAFSASVFLCNAVKALLEQGQVEPAAEIVRKHAPDTVTADRWPLHAARAAVDLRRGRLGAACERLQGVAVLEVRGDLANTKELVEQLVEVRLWAEEPAVALREAEQMLVQLPGTDEAAHAGELLGLAGRALADLAEVARARRDDVAQHAAHRAGARLEALVSSMAGAPFTPRDHHPAAVRVGSDLLQWQAELARSRGASDPGLWQRCAREWSRLGRPHRAAYALWRAAEALLTRRTHVQEARMVLRQAAALADGMEPLLRQVTELARRARVELAPTSAPTDARRLPEPTHPTAVLTDPFALSPRERQVLDLLAAGRTNAQIGAELYISPKTASVHVTNILRKLGVDNRTHAAATAERAGLLSGSPAPGRTDAGRRPAG